jgi:hypothetical protein
VGKRKNCCVKMLQVNLMVHRGGLSRILCCCKYMKVVLTFVCSFIYHCVGLLDLRVFLEGCTAVSYVCVWCHWHALIW